MGNLPIEDAGAKAAALAAQLRQTADVYSSDETDLLLAAKANAANVYTKSEIDGYTASRPDAGALADADQIEVVQGGTAKKGALSGLWTYIKGKVAGAPSATAGVSRLLGLDENGDFAASDNILKGSITLAASDGTVQLETEDVLDAVSNFATQGGASGFGPALFIKGTSADITGYFAAKGNGEFWWGNGFGGVFGMQHTAGFSGLVPFSPDGSALGSPTLQWSDLYLASGGVINWANGDVQMSHSTGLISLVGAFRATSLTVEGAAGTARLAKATTSGVNRWIWGAYSTAESGGNAGSEWVLGRYSDAGAFQDFPIVVDRATGRVTILKAAFTESYTATQIADKTHAVNTTGKVNGKEIWDSTNHRKLHTEGSTDVSPWYVVGGGASVTPA